MSVGEWALLCLLGAIWGSSFFFGKVALAEVGPLTIVLVRVVIAAVVLNLLLLARGQRLPGEARLWGWFFVMGLVNSLLPFCLIFWGQTLIPSGLASILNATTPLFGVLIGHFITRTEPLTPLRTGGVLVGFAGVAAMLGPGLLHTARGDVIAELAVLIAALLYAVAGFYGRRFRGLPSLIPATGAVTATAVMMLPLALIAERPWQNVPHTGAVIGSLLSLGLLSTALAYLIYFHLLATAGAGNVLLVTFIIPVSATLLGCLILHEQLGPQHFVGMALVFAGLAAIDGRPFKWLQPKGADSS